MRRLITALLAVLSVFAVSISICMLVGMALEDRKSAAAFDEIKTIFEQDETGNDDAGGGEQDPADASAGDGEGAQEVQINEGLLELHAINPDCVGWIRIEDTQIDYPVMYHPEETDYYLRKNFYGEYDISGTPYIAEHCDPETADNLLIYGHHMNNGAMFAALDEYKSEDFFREHPRFTYSTLHGDETYEIIACFAVPVYTGNDFCYYAFAMAEDKESFDTYVKKCRQLSYYDCGVDAEYGDRLVTLSTCEYTHTNGRMVVVGRLMKERNE